MSDNLEKIADEIQEDYRYTGGEAYAKRIRAIAKEAREELQEVMTLIRTGNGSSRG